MYQSKLAQVVVAEQLNQAYYGDKVLAIQRAPISASTSGNTTIVGATANQVIHVLKWTLAPSAPADAVGAKFRSFDGTSTYTDLTGVMGLPAAGGHAAGGHFVTNRGEALALNLSGAIAVGGYLSYVTYTP